MLTFVAVTAVVICSWILILAFLVDVSRSQENDKLEQAAPEPVPAATEPKDTGKDAASAEEEKKEPEKDCDSFVCPENRGNYADPCTCRRFYICSTDGAAHRSFCPNGLYWDDEKK